MVALAEWIQQDETASDEGGSFASTRLSELDTQPKNRVWDFFGVSPKPRRETEPQVVEAHLVVLVVVEYDASVCYKYLYVHANPVIFVDPSGRYSLIEALYTARMAQMIYQIAVPTIVAGVNIAVQGRIYQVLRPLADELSLLSKELHSLSPEAAMRINGSVTKIQDVISAGNIAFNVLFPTAASAVGGSAGVGIGLGIALARAYLLEEFVSSVVTNVAEGASFDNGVAYYRASGSVNGWSSLYRIFRGKLNPANDVSKLTDFVRSVKARNAHDAERNFVKFGKRLAQYGDFDADFGLRGSVGAFSGAGFAWFKTQSGTLTYGYIVGGGI
ncbi:hypothetical protein IEN85_02095 [Pelagicoccus sp. NFK12]|uniref:Uncharacterized protein n=1 Tax=Pelagicoccus enzymogenes TaxID=2773457 RepID=A0A927F4K4_9BACT|nr:hypothetical protein [Pelagicoccus enzymogenes]MBD5778283.1 hypothetical protein [Pelagicoccus enzymogenes]